MPPKGSQRKRKTQEISAMDEEEIRPPKESVIERLWQGPVGFPDFLEGYASLQDFFTEHPDTNPYTFEPWSMDDYAFLTNYMDLMTSNAASSSNTLNTRPELSTEPTDQDVSMEIIETLHNTSYASEPSGENPQTLEELRDARLRYYTNLEKRPSVPVSELEAVPISSVISNETVIQKERAERRELMLKGRI